MDLTVSIIIITLLYGIVMFLDFFFKSCMMLPYVELLKRTGLSIKLFRINFHFLAFNRLVNRYSSKLPSLYKRSFKLGFYVAIFLLPVSLSLMVISLFNFESSQESSDASNNINSADSAHLEILLPGINLPLDQIIYYIISLLICSVVHEAGHGIAAIIEDISVSGFGLQIFFVIPIAYTQIDTEILQNARVWKKLKIFR